ncbi:MAG: hypothetical protein AUG51_11990 [Acidobacteria bacterium 13_1_20CM_3_53_8]|nr:MAG: hypothetical protein AUG51_11990 [Acidobacteria bacterium 13_1_20CM_3_53_8]
MIDFQCLMYSGVPFSEEIKNFLVDTARHMKRKRIERQPFKSDAYEGEIRTKFTPYFVSSSLHGIMFTAELECEEGRTIVRYLVTPEQLKKKSKSEWSPWYRIETSHPRDNAANN